MHYEQPVLPRSAGSIPGRRVPQEWPPDRDFRILSIDGGGIRGIFPAAVLADFELGLGGASSIADYFDLAAGTSTGGIIALSLGAGKTSAEIRHLYLTRARTSSRLSPTTPSAAHGSPCARTSSTQRSISTTDLHLSAPCRNF